MKSADEIIAEKFSELVKRYSKDGELKNFSEAEIAIWYLVSVRCKIDIDGFEEVFFVTLSKEELRLFVAMLYKLAALPIANYFDEIFQLLDKYNAWIHFTNAKTIGEASKFFSDLPEIEKQRFEQLEDLIRDRDDLWNLDEKLLAWLIEEGNTKLNNR